MQAFTSRFQEALQTAQSIAVGKDSNYIEPAGGCGRRHLARASRANRQ